MEIFTSTETIVYLSFRTLYLERFNVVIKVLFFMDNPVVNPILYESKRSITLQP